MIEYAPIENHQRLNYTDSVLYCQFLDIDGKRDWRVPRPGDIVDRRYEVNAMIADGGCTSMHYNAEYWIDIKYSGGSNAVIDGLGEPMFVTRTFEAYIMPVRDIV